MFCNWKLLFCFERIYFLRIRVKRRSICYCMSRNIKHNSITLQFTADFVFQQELQNFSTMFFNCFILIILLYLWLVKVSPIVLAQLFELTRLNCWTTICIFKKLYVYYIKQIEINYRYFVVFRKMYTMTKNVHNQLIRYQVVILLAFAFTCLHILASLVGFLVCFGCWILLFISAQTNQHLTLTIILYRNRFFSWVVLMYRATTFQG